MRISTLEIENFRSIRHLRVNLDDTTVFLGPNNAGKTAVLDAVRIALSRRWGQRGTGFVEDDVHRPDETTDPRVAPPVRIKLEFQEPSASAWPAEMVADLDDVMAVDAHTSLNKLAVAVSYKWNLQNEAFEPAWEFYDAAGNPLPPRRRAVNLSGLFDYLPFFPLGALRDAEDEFAARSRNWGGLLRGAKLAAELETNIKDTLDELDTSLLGADPKFGRIAKTVGRATEIAMEATPGAAKLRMVPLDIWDLLSRATLVLRNEDRRPWLPLRQHGQGLQSLAVVFLLQAAMEERASELKEGAEPIFAVEEPEVHLHPQAARMLWTRISQLPGQKILTTHSPYFVQNVPLHNLRVLRIHNGATEVSALPHSVNSDLPWTTEVENLVKGRRLTQFTRDPSTGTLTSTWHFDDSLARDLSRCFASNPTVTGVQVRINAFRHGCRVLISPEEEADLALLGRRIRGEVFFAHRWVMVEGPSEYLLLGAIGKGLNYDLDQHGVAVVDFQNCGNAGTYPALADAFGIPWYMVTDGDAESVRFRGQLLSRGFTDVDLTDRFFTLTPPNDLEDQLLADGHEQLLRDIMTRLSGPDVAKCPIGELRRRLKNQKTAYMSLLAPMVEADSSLAERMPEPLVAIVKRLRSGGS